MKARVKATGDIIEVSRIADKYIQKNHPHNITFDKEELYFEDDFEPDYWTKLKHQYVGIIFATTYSSALFEYNTKDEIYFNAILMASELIDKLKEDESNKKT